MLNSYAPITVLPPVAFNIPRPNRLRAVINHAHELGAAGVHEGDAREEIEDALWGDGLLPIDRASQKRAWTLTHDLAVLTFREGGAVFARKVADAEIAAERSVYAVLYATAYHAARCADDDVIVDAVREALAAAGRTSDFGGASPLWPVMRARAAQVDDDRSELDSLALPVDPPAFMICDADDDGIVVINLDVNASSADDADDAVEASTVQKPEWPSPVAVLADPIESASSFNDIGKAPDLLALEGWAMDSGAIDLSAAIRRERLGIAKPVGAGGLAFLDFDPAHSSPPPTWLAKGLLPRTGIGLLYGESGAGKSFAAIHTALSIAWGLPLFGSRTKRGAVLYVAAEGGKSVLRRFKAANDAIGGAVAAANLTRNPGEAPLRRAPIRVVHEAPDLSRDGSADPLIRTIRNAVDEFERAGERLALVIVDTWHAAMGGGDENSAADAGHALKPLIAESEAGDFLTLIVHHPGKDSERGARGSNALPAAADAIIAITVPGHTGAVAKPSTAVRRAVVTKMRDGEAGGGFDYRLNIVAIGIDEDGEPVTTCTVSPYDTPALDVEGLTQLDREFLEAVTAAVESGSDRAQANEVRSRFYAGRPDAKTDARRKAWSRALRSALDAGRVEMDDHDTWMWLRAAAE